TPSSSCSCTRANSSRSNRRSRGRHGLCWPLPPRQHGGNVVENIVPDMPVYDAEGEKIGMVSRVHRHAAVATGGIAHEPTEDAEDFFEVKTGFLGLGSHYYIPFSAVREVSEGGGIYIDKPKDSLDGLGWNVDPLKPTAS